MGKTPMNSSQKLGLVIVGVIVAIGTFGPGRRPDKGAASPEETATLPSSTINNGETKEALKVETASPKQLGLIREVVERGLTVRTAYAVRSQTHKRGYYVGAKIYGPGLENGAPAVWLISGEKGDPGMILSVDAVAAEFSAPMLASKTKAGASSSDPEAEAVLSYLRGH
jgi:hypothetical protein